MSRRLLPSMACLFASCGILLMPSTLAAATPCTWGCSTRPSDGALIGEFGTEATTCS
eukprot:CAMPEP_0172872164 /NCGR_PEP_ID=MMETSP1075-20121228/92487_1 /TAXON_ID=2916 /ORGANISM="Ceratium fusus, Strain PA161109" /LENGTH=56 /DNA_ID=CAMNT_0013722473 /DNA_START=167 /DNA_END=334 /DNA_ORIENTATION=+